MGYILHHAIVVTGSDYRDENKLTAAYAKATELGLSPSLIQARNEGLNGYKSFFVPPDGSKEGWAESDAGDKGRDEFIAFLRSLAHGDGSTPVCWAEVAFGGDEPGLNTKVTRANGLRRKTERGT